MKRYFLILNFLILSPQVKAQSPILVHKNNAGVEAMRAEKPAEAIDQFSEALSDSEKDAVLHFNLGGAFEQSKDADKALQEYQTAFKESASKEIKFMALFNRARLLGDLKKIDEALSTYQQALEIRPDSVEVKTNIELLLKSGGGKGKDDNQKSNQGDQGQNQDKNKQDDKKDQKGDQDQKKDQQKDQESQKPKPKPFKGESLSPNDVKNILEELKRQEDQIRQKLNNQQTKERPNGKDW